jgi:hypothetical protein
MPKKTFDIEIRERAERFCLELMADHPELEAVGLVFLSRHLRDVLAAMVVGADGPLLRPDQTVRLVANQQRDVQILDELLAQYARRLADAQAREAQAGEELSDRTPQA